MPYRAVLSSIHFVTNLSIPEAGAAFIPVRSRDREHPEGLVVRRRSPLTSLASLAVTCGRAVGRSNVLAVIALLGHLLPEH
ncbi:hypothetical protein MMAG44476_19112 [Mycolicibacterium mageritense DSM 44476 = CIP 104973]|nr:hypothetical protein BN978_04021 [Mycolicibacterium mageritense DSM 44476 = CIP 104973]